MCTPNVHELPGIHHLPEYSSGGFEIAAQVRLTAMNADGFGTALSHGSACDLEAILNKG
jgi:hypothetical protein